MHAGVPAVVVEEPVPVVPVVAVEVDPVDLVDVVPVDVVPVLGVDAVWVAWVRVTVTVLALFEPPQAPIRRPAASAQSAAAVARIDGIPRFSRTAKRILPLTAAVHATICTTDGPRALRPPRSPRSS
jgi:hypothetical protein